MVRVVTDSTADVPPEMAEKLGITVVPAYVAFGTETYQDGVDLTKQQFYDRLSASRVIPTTAAPPIGAYEEVFRRLWIELPASPESQRAQELLAGIPTARPPTADERFQRAATLYQLGQYGPAIPELAPFAVAGSPREAEARMR